MTHTNHSPSRFPRIFVEVHSLARHCKGFRGKFSADPAAIHCMAPANKLKAAGITPKGTATHRFPDGTSVRFQYGFARLRFRGREIVAQIVFGHEHCEPILGIAALDSTGIMVEPVSHTFYAKALCTASKVNRPASTITGMH